MFHQVSQMFLPDVFVMVDPSYHCLKNLHNKVHTLITSGAKIWSCCPTWIYWAGWMCVYLLLCGDGELVAGDQARHLLHAQIEELFTPNHLSEMLLCQHKHQINKNYSRTAGEHSLYFSSQLCFSTFSLIKPVLIPSHLYCHTSSRTYRNPFRQSNKRCSQHTDTHKQNNWVLHTYKPA